MPVVAVTCGLWQPASQHVRENDRVVVFGVVGGVHERERALPRPASKLGDPRTLVAELLRVASTELLEAARLVSEPLPQLGARRQLARSLVELSPVARDPSRPEPIDLHAIAVGGCGRVIHALQANVH